MSLQSLRNGSHQPVEPILYDLEPLRLPGRTVGVTLSVRLAEEGVWRGHLEFDGDEPAGRRVTAEIFRGPSEADLWESVRTLREYHLRDLYRSLE